MEELEKKNQEVDEITNHAAQTSSPARRVRSASATAEDIDNGITKVTTQCEEAVSKIILKSIPSDSQITFVRFEGPNIALYTKNPKFALTELTYFLSSLSKTLKKRFIIRTDPSSRLPEDQTRQAVAKLLPKDVQVSAIFCDDATGEVVLEVSKPEAIDPNMLVQIAQSTGWIHSHQTLATYSLVQHQHAALHTEEFCKRKDRISAKARQARIQRISYS